MNNCFSRGILHFESAAILLFGTHAQPLMLAGVVFAKERGQPLIQLIHGFVAKDINVVILHRAPEPLDHDVVQSVVFAVHADFDAMSLQRPREGFAGELATLIAVEDLRLSFELQRFFQAFHTEGFVHAVAEFPTDHVAARPVYHRCQVNVSIIKLRKLSVSEIIP